jgi:glycosyltransferase involved in cell wall biosynthesis
MHVITDFSSSAGAQTMLARLLRASRDERTVVVSIGGISTRNRALAEGGRLELIALNATTLAQMPAAAMRLARIVWREKPDVIVCWMYHAMILGTIASKLAGSGARLCWNVRQSLDDPASLTRSTRLAVALARLISRSPSLTIYNSTRALELHQRYGYRDRKAIVIPNGVETPDLPARSLGRPRVVGIAGRLHAQKDYPTFFRAAALVLLSVPDARFVAVGSGLTLENADVARMLENAELPSRAIELCGEVADMSGFFDRIDILALSSRTEGFPNVIAEAMAHGKVVVTTDVGDAAEIVADTGFVCPPRDPEALAGAMKAALDLSAEAFAEHTQSARRRVEALYRLDVIAERYREVLNA